MQDSGHTPEWTGQTVERLRKNGKRIFMPAFKTWLIEQANKPGTSVAGLAMRHGVNANQLRRWMSLATRVSSAPSSVMLPVRIVAATGPVPPLESVAPVGMRVAFEIEVAGAVVRVFDGVEARNLRVVLDVLRA